MKIGYLDPPYPNCAHLYRDHDDYGGEVDHAALIESAERDYDGWVLHTSSTDGLRVVMPLIAKLKGVRVMAWVKPFSAFKRNIPVAYSWDPVIVKAARKPVVSKRQVSRDFIEEAAVKESITMKRGLTGAKPEKVCHWAFEMVGARPEDELVDLFPGTGAVTRAWKSWQGLFVLPVDEVA